MNFYVKTGTTDISAGPPPGGDLVFGLENDKKIDLWANTFLHLPTGPSGEPPYTGGGTENAIIFYGVSGGTGDVSSYCSGLYTFENIMVQKVFLGNVSGYLRLNGNDVMGGHLQMGGNNIKNASNSYCFRFELCCERSICCRPSW